MDTSSNSFFLTQNDLVQASQMQGFFAKPVDNLFAEPLIARWIRMNVPDWRDAVVVSKNAGGTKRVTSLADTLKLNFGIVTTDRRRPKANLSMTDSMVFFDTIEKGNRSASLSVNHLNALQNSAVDDGDYFLSKSADTLRPETPPAARRLSELEAADHTTDERAREVITGRIFQGHLVDDDFIDESQIATPLPPAGSESGDSTNNDHMTASFMSITSSREDHALGGTYDAGESDEDDPVAAAAVNNEKTITLVGNVKNKAVFIIDDMIDGSGSWITAAETVVRRGGAKSVYCIATHGLFGDNSLEEMENSDVIDHIVVTNSFPIPPEKARLSKKLTVIDVSGLLSESIRRHHYGERLVRRCQIPTRI